VLDRAREAASMAYLRGVAAGRLAGEALRRTGVRRPARCPYRGPLRWLAWRAGYGAGLRDEVGRG
jgi:hypothetical protein